MTQSIVVVGAGVSGLSCALRLLEQGCAVRIWTREPSAVTTSSIAAAFWYPYLAEPLDKVARWSAVALAEFTRLAHVPDCGVQWRAAKVLYDEYEEDPVWATSGIELRPLPKAALPAGVAAGFTLRLPVIDMPIYLGWLVARVEALGGHIEIKELASLAPALAKCDRVVNCSGLGARELVGDESVYPIRGQVLSVDCPEVDQLTFRITHDERPTYIVPRTRDCILGGTSQPSASRAIDPATSAAIRERCVSLQPELRSAPLLAEKVGLRPCRAAVRLEREVLDSGQTVIHNYGHGGAGVTLSWGCAEEVAKLAMS